MAASQWWVGQDDALRDEFLGKKEADRVQWFVMGA
jgi:hypothetical protein